MTNYQYQTDTLENGLRLHWLTLPHTHSVAMQAFVRAGSAYETKKINGVSHFWEHLHMATTRNYPSRAELQHRMDDLSVERNANTWFDWVSFDFVGPSSNLEPIVDLIGEVLEIRDFDESVFESERKLLLSELATSDDVQPASLKQLFKDHPLGLDLGGRPRVIRRLTPDDIHGFQRAVFLPNRIDVVVVGPISNHAHDSIRRRLSHIDNAPSPHLPPPKLPVVTLPFFGWIPGAWRKSYVELGFMIDTACPTRDAVALGALWYGLSLPSCPLFEKVRYTGGSTYHWEISRWSACGVELFIAQAYTLSKHRTSLIELVLREIRDIQDGRINVNWLKNLTQSYRFAVEQCLDVPSTMADIIGREEVAIRQPAISIVEELQIIQQLSPTEARDVARRWFSWDRMFLSFTPRTRFRDEARVRKMARSCLT